MTPTLTHRSAVRRRSSIVATLKHLYSVWRQRQTLKTLDAARLRDIGITRGEAYGEARRLFWDAPQHWN